MEETVPACRLPSDFVGNIKIYGLNRNNLMHS